MNRLFGNKLLFAAILSALFIAGCQEMDFVDPNGPSLEQTTVQTLVTGIQAGIRINNEFYLRDVAVIGRKHTISSLPMRKPIWKTQALHSDLLSQTVLLILQLRKNLSSSAED